jgi:hypothetical protein
MENKESKCVRKGCQRQSLKPPSSAAFCEGNPAPGTAQGANCLTWFACTRVQPLRQDS